MFLEESEGAPTVDHLFPSVIYDTTSPRGYNLTPHVRGAAQKADLPMRLNGQESDYLGR